MSNGDKTILFSGPGSGRLKELMVTRYLRLDRTIFSPVRQAKCRLPCWFFLPGLCGGLDERLGQSARTEDCLDGDWTVRKANAIMRTRMERPSTTVDW